MSALPQSPIFGRSPSPSHVNSGGDRTDNHRGLGLLVRSVSGSGSPAPASALSPDASSSGVAVATHFGVPGSKDMYEGPVPVVSLSPKEIFDRAVAVAKAHLPNKTSHATFDEYVHMLLRSDQAGIVAALDKAWPKHNDAMREAIKAVIETAFDVQNKHMLQRHLEAFRHGDNEAVSPWDTYAACRALGMSRINAMAITAFSYGAAIGMTHHINIDDDVINGMRHSSADSTAFAAQERTQQEMAHMDDIVDQIMAHAPPPQSHRTQPYLELAHFHEYIDQREPNPKHPANAAVRWIMRKANMAEFKGLVDVCGGQVTREQLRDFFRGTLLIYLRDHEPLAEKIVSLRGRAFPDPSVLGLPVHEPAQ